jgi:Uma2 family endonuclease
MLRGLDDFRTWAQSDAFPEKGRVDWVEGNLWIDMSPEEFNTHGTPKAAITRDLSTLVEGGDRGVVVVDATRITMPGADVSSEPDVVVLLFDTIASGRARLVPRAGDRAGFVEVEGAPDVVVECVGGSSVRKDTISLRRAYFRGGVPEHWVVDAREDPPRVDLLRRGAEEYEPTASDAGGFTRSMLLGRAVRLVRLPERLGVVRYRLEMRD